MIVHTEFFFRFLNFFILGIGTWQNNWDLRGFVSINYSWSLAGFFCCTLKWGWGCLEYLKVLLLPPIPHWLQPHLPVLHSWTPLGPHVLPRINHPVSSITYTVWSGLQLLPYFFFTELYNVPSQLRIVPPFIPLSTNFPWFIIPYLVITLFSVYVLYLTLNLMNATTTILLLTIDPGFNVVTARYVTQLSVKEKKKKEISDACTINSTKEKDI